MNPIDPLADPTSTATEPAVSAAQQRVNEGMERLVGNIDSVRAKVAPVIQRAAEDAGNLARRSVEAVRDGQRQVHDTAVRSTERAVANIRDEPVKAVLIAAAAGALLVLLASAVRGRSTRDPS